MPLYPLPQIRTDEDGWAIYHAAYLTDEQRAPLAAWLEANGLDMHKIVDDGLTVRRESDGRYLARFNEFVDKSGDEAVKARRVVEVSGFPEVTL